MQIRVPSHLANILPASLGARCATPFFLNFAFYLVDGIIYRKKNNEIRIIYHRGRCRAFCKIYLQSSSSVLSVSLLKALARARARPRKIICYRHFVIAVSLKSLCASYLRPSNPEGVFLADATGVVIEKGCASSCSPLRNIMRFYPLRGSTAFARIRACTVILASARISLLATQFLYFSSFLFFPLAYFSIACVIREIEREISNRNENGDITVQWKCQ